MRKILLLTTMFAFVLTASAWAADISGKWTVTWWGAGAEESFPIVIKAAGENLAVTGTHPAFGEMTGSGTLEGDSVSLTLKSPSMEIDLTGKLAGNKMEGTREIKSAGGGRDGGAPGGEAPQGEMPEGAGGHQGGQGGAPDGAAMSGGAGAPQAQGGQGTDAAGGNENWVAVKG